MAHPEHLQRCQPLPNPLTARKLAYGLLISAREAPRAHTHLTVSLDGGRKELRFRDTRRFGSATVFQDEQSLNSFFETSGLGPEPFGLDPSYWRVDDREVDVRYEFWQARRRIISYLSQVVGAVRRDDIGP